MPGSSSVIVAHRGLHPLFPENSLAAFRAAWDAGLVWCECDIHLSADGIPVVIHDDTLERTTTGHCRVADFSASQLSSLKLLDADGKPTNHSLPLLEEILEQMPGHALMMVEPKPPLGDRILPIARRLQEAGGMLHSFHQDDMELADRATDHRLPCAVLAETADDVRSELQRLHLNFELLDSASLVHLRNAGKKIGIWTVNDIEAIRSFAKLGIEMIITDIPLAIDLR